mmetsp:Transcript_14090/g.29032  ORF Transcript_14090/g.29032 Transcript_14090/m.29032 type:complete len:121 (+) Transcript_14090:655-1017(+)
MNQSSSLHPPHQLLLLPLPLPLCNKTPRRDREDANTNDKQGGGPSHSRNSPDHVDIEWRRQQQPQEHRKERNTTQHNTTQHNTAVWLFGCLIDRYGAVRDASINKRASVLLRKENGYTVP